MDITCLQEQDLKQRSTLQIIFHRFNSQFKIKNGEYPFISKLRVFGFNGIYKKIYSLVGTVEEKILDTSISIDEDSNALTIEDLQLLLQSESSYKLIIEF